jgi:hypothetical protein
MPWVTPGPALQGAYLVPGELPFHIALHILDLLIIYLTQQSINLQFNHRTLETPSQDKILEEMDETIQAIFAAIHHFLHIPSHL